MTTRNQSRRTPRTWAYPLWKLMHDEHHLLLLESELQEIVDIVRAMKPDPQPYTMHPAMKAKLKDFARRHRKPRRKPLTNKARVLRKEPNAVCRKGSFNDWIILDDPGAQDTALSRWCSTPAAAWADAAANLTT